VLEDALTQLQNSPRLGVYQFTSTEPSLIVVDLRGASQDRFVQWVVDAGVDLLAALRSTLIEAKRAPARLCVILIEPTAVADAARPALEASAAMVRAAVISVAVDRANTLLTTVRLREDDLAELWPTINFLASDDASYMTAASLDIRRGSS
jgi:hypothetical protein